MIVHSELTGIQDEESWSFPRYFPQHFLESTEEMLHKPYSGQAASQL
jgi:hypothetical protein